jgi:hydrogenase maturation factor
MCLGVPLQVIEIDAASEGAFAWCEGRIAGELRRERLNILWLGEVLPGEWVFASLGQAKERLPSSRPTKFARHWKAYRRRSPGKRNSTAISPT